jgi:hypothetical protein
MVSWIFICYLFAQYANFRIFSHLHSINPTWLRLSLRFISFFGFHRILLPLIYATLNHIFFLFSIFYFITLAVDSAILRTASCSHGSHLHPFHMKLPVSDVENCVSYVAPLKLRMNLKLSTNFMLSADQSTNFMQSAE